MACAGCGAKYRRISNLTRRVPTNPLVSKYPKTRTPSKKASIPVTPKNTTDPQLAIGLLSSIANSIPK